MLHLNAFLFGCGHHSAAWRHPNSRVEDLGDIRYYEDLARTAERGKLDAVFFADGHSVRDPAGAGTWFLEPITALTAMARATTHIGLVTTVSTTFYTPFHAARLLSSLDHISGGRAGWNVVTSMFDAEARNHGYGEIPLVQSVTPAPRSSSRLHCRCGTVGMPTRSTWIGTGGTPIRRRSAPSITWASTSRSTGR